jgi:hypothetical protein
MGCCLCSNPVTSHSEQRPTGQNDLLETWHYCPECWREITRQRADRDPFVLSKYVVFLQYLHGGYRMQRSFQGSQASKIVRN